MNKKCSIDTIVPRNSEFTITTITPKLPPKPTIKLYGSGPLYPMSKITIRKN